MPQTAKIFTTGRSQAILSEKPESWDDFFNASLQVSADFMEKRVDLPLQERVFFQ